jgi:hypothetical protein
MYDNYSGSYDWMQPQQAQATTATSPVNTAFGSATTTSPSWYDQGRYDSALASQTPGADGRNILNPENAFGILNNLTGLQKSQESYWNANPNYVGGNVDSAGDGSAGSWEMRDGWTNGGQHFHPNADGTFSTSYNMPGSTSNADQINASYTIDANGNAVPVSGTKTYHPSSWVSSGRDFAKYAALAAAGGYAAAGMAGAGVGAEGLAGTGVAGGSAGTGNMALLESQLGTAGYGASSAGLGGSVPTFAGNAIGASLGAGASSPAALVGQYVGESALTGGADAATSAAWANGASGLGMDTVGTVGGGGAVGGIPSWLSDMGVNAAKGAASGAIKSGVSGGNIMNGAINGAVGGGASTAGPWGSFLASLLPKAGSSGLGAYFANKQGNNEARQYQNQMAQINGLYAPDSAYAKQMEQTLARKDSAGGRNSQYGPRAEALAANLTKSKSDAINSANFTNLIGGNINAQNQFPASLMALMQQGKGGTNPIGSLINSGVNSGVDWLTKLFQNQQSGSTPSYDPGGTGGYDDYYYGEKP